MQKFLLPFLGRIQYLVLVLALVFCLASCDDEKTQTAQQPAVQPFVLKFGHDMPADSAQHVAAVAFAKQLAKLSNNQLQVEIYPNNQLGDDEQMILLAQRGELDIILPPTAKLSSVAPAFQAFDIPFLFADLKQAHAALDGSVGYSLLTSLKQHQLIGLAFWESGMKQFTSNRSLKELSDFQAVHFRVMPSALLQDQFRMWGAQSSVVSYSKTLQALADGVVDGVENPLTSIEAMKFHQAQTHLTISNHGYLAQVFAVSAHTFSQLTTQQQDWIVQAALEVTPMQRSLSERMQQDSLNELQATGMQVEEIPVGLKRQLQQLAAPLVEKYRMVIGTRIIEQLLQFVSEQEAKENQNYYIGLDADMAGNSAESGLAIRRGIELALDEINQAGGILGKPVQLVVRDNSMIPARGLANLEYFNKLPNLLAVYSGISSPVALAELDYLHKNNLLFMVPWAAATKIVHNGFVPNNVFRVSVRDEFAGGFLVKHALAKGDKVALLLVNNPWGRSNFKAMTEALAQHGHAPVIVEWFDWGEQSLDVKVKRIQSKQAEVVIFVGNAIEAAKFIHALSGYSEKPMVLSHWGITGSIFSQSVGPMLDDVDLRVLQTFSFIGNSSLKAQNLIKRYRQKYFIDDISDIVAPVGTAHAYDLTHMLAKAIEVAGSVDSDKVRHALENLTDFTGVVKHYDQPFSKTRHDALNADSFMLARYRGHALVPIESDEVLNAH